MLVVGILIGLVGGAAGAILVLRLWEGSRLTVAQRKRELIVAEAEREAESLRREAQIEAREQDVRLRAQVEDEIRERRDQITKVEERVLAREQDIEAKLTELGRREQGVTDRETHARQLQDELRLAAAQETAALERIAGMTTAEAKQHLLERSEDMIRHELARRVRQMEEEARAEAKRRARNLVADALQRVAASHAAESTVSVVELPS